MEELRIKIEALLDANASKEFVSNMQLSEMIIDTIRGHKSKDIKECPRCASTNKKTSLIFHHKCNECDLKY